jgi:hypothetical protein
MHRQTLRSASKAIFDVRCCTWHRNGQRLSVIGATKFAGDFRGVIAITFQESFMRTLLLSLSALFMGFIVVPQAAAVPSYARQTGLACNGCHYTPPELNRAGRMFKLMGYIDKVRNAEVTAPEDKKHAGLDLLATLPLSAWFETSFTNTRAPQPKLKTATSNFPRIFPCSLPAHGPPTLVAFSR